MNKLKRKRLAKQAIALPTISPSINKYAISQTIDLVISAQKDKLPAKEYINLFRNFERDFTDNKLSEQFDRALQQSLKEKDLQGVEEAEIIKSLSREIKIKMFQNYLSENKMRYRSGKRYSSSSVPRYQTIVPKPQTGPVHQRSANERRCSIQRILDIRKGVENEEILVKNNMKNFYRKLNNKKLYYQMLSPLYADK